MPGSLPGFAYVHTDGADKRFLYVGQQVQDVLGYGPERWLRDPSFGVSLIYPDDLVRMQAACREAPREDIDVAVFRQVARDGRVLTICDASVVRPTNGGDRIWTGVCLDLSALVTGHEVAGGAVDDRRPRAERIAHPLALGGATPATEQPPHLERVEVARVYIADHLAEPLRVSQLARVVALSPSYLSRLFRAYVGEPPHRFLVRLRLEHAKDLLATTSLSVTSIASRVGFRSASHFVTTFRAHFGTTPGAYRRNLQSSTTQQTTTGHAGDSFSTKRYPEVDI
jgi:AraC-like DNA-binding protein